MKFISALMALVATSQAEQLFDPHDLTMSTFAVAVMTKAGGSTEEVTGFIRMSQLPGQDVRIVGEIRNLPDNESEEPRLHAFHIHESGDISGEGCLATGEHFNPMNMTHGGPGNMTRHYGDLGNIEADAEGTAKFERFDRYISI